MRIQRLVVRKELLPDPVWNAVQVTSLLWSKQVSDHACCRNEVSRLQRHPHPVVPLWSPSRAGAACPTPRTSSAAAVSPGRRRGSPRASGQDFCGDTFIT